MAVYATTNKNINNNNNNSKTNALGLNVLKIKNALSKNL